MIESWLIVCGDLQEGYPLPNARQGGKGPISASLNGAFRRREFPDGTEIRSGLELAGLSGARQGIDTAVRPGRQYRLADVDRIERP